MILSEYKIWVTAINPDDPEKARANPGRLSEVLEICAEQRGLMTPMMREIHDRLVANKPKETDSLDSWIGAALLVAAIDDFQERLRKSSRMTT